MFSSTLNVQKKVCRRKKTDTLFLYLLDNSLPIQTGNPNIFAPTNDLSTDSVEKLLLKFLHKASLFVADSNRQKSLQSFRNKKKKQKTQLDIVALFTYICYNNHII